MPLIAEEVSRTEGEEEKERRAVIKEKEMECLIRDGISGKRGR